MIPADLAKAQIVDIRHANAPPPRIVVVDANVLYIIAYDFTTLAAAGGHLPPDYQRRLYPAWWKRALGGKVQLCTSAGCLAEFAHVVERTEIEILWRTDPIRPELDPNDPGLDFTARFTKSLRYHYHGHLKRIREGVETALSSIRKTVNILPQVGQDAAFHELAVQQWVRSAADFGDAELVAAAKRAGILHIISDDADLVTFEGITLYTANHRAIDAAKRSKRDP